MKRKFTLSIILMGGMLFAQAPKSVTYGQNTVAMKFAETITIDDLKEDLTILSSDALEGRETGKRGQKMAAVYIRAHFQEIGLEAPVSHGDTKSFFQDVKLKTSKPGDIYLLVNDEKFKNIDRIKKAEEKELEKIIGKAKTRILLEYFKNHPGTE